MRQSLSFRRRTAEESAAAQCSEKRSGVAHGKHVRVRCFSVDGPECGTCSGRARSRGERDSSAAFGVGMTKRGFCHSHSEHGSEGDSRPTTAPEFVIRPGLSFRRRTAEESAAAQCSEKRSGVAHGKHVRVRCFFVDGPECGTCSGRARSRGERDSSAAFGVGMTKAEVLSFPR